MVASQQALPEQSALLGLLEAAAQSIGKRLDLLYFLSNHPWVHVDSSQAKQAIGLFASLRGVSDHQDVLLNLVEARLHCFAKPGCRIAVFSMPKSGSSYLSEILCQSLGVSRVNLDSCALNNTEAGCNAREDELDEMALIKATLLYGDWVAQHHTRASASLMYSLRNYQIQPIVMMRNILDCLVSFDDMMMEWNYVQGESARRSRIFFNTGGRLPFHYIDLGEDARYAVLAQAWGRWYLEFYMSWKRAKLSGLCDPLLIRYEDHVVNPEILRGLLCEELGLLGIHGERLEQCLHDRVRFNQGVVGRGARIPADVRSLLGEMADGYGMELSGQERQYLLG
jgi:hypothetical protein